MMKKLMALMLAFLLACPALAEEDTLIIAVTGAGDALMFAAEEAFFDLHPEAVIEYRLYTFEQISAMLMTGTADFDLVLLSSFNLKNLHQKGYLRTVSDALGLTDWPETLIDLSAHLTAEGEIFALPVCVTQSCYFWDRSRAKEAGLSYPAVDDVWTWEDYAALSDQLPRDTNGDGEPDVYLIGGTNFALYPALKDMNVDMFTSWLALYPDRFGDFMTGQLDLFRKVMKTDSILAMEQAGDYADPAAVLISRTGAGNPLTAMQDGIEILMPPVFDRDDVRWPGALAACGLLADAPHGELAADFLRAMLSEAALDHAMYGCERFIVSREKPTRMWRCPVDWFFIPTFTEEDGHQVYRVTAGRELEELPFTASEADFRRTQAIRERLAVDPAPMGRDFYDAAWGCLQEWYLGHMDDGAFIEAMTFLHGMVTGE